MARWMPPAPQGARSPLAAAGEGGASRHGKWQVASGKRQVLCTSDTHGCQAPQQSIGKALKATGPEERIPDGGGRSMPLPPPSPPDMRFPLWRSWQIERKEPGPRYLRNS
jgi:hypothetical protein